jgi:hypothetical protein
MTPRELFDQGVRRIRIPAWNRMSYIELAEVEGSIAPWVKLYDPASMEGHTDLPLMYIGSSNYEEWKG